MNAAANTELEAEIPGAGATPEGVTALASRRARVAYGAWREAQQKRLYAARRAEVLAKRLQTLEQRAEARIAREADTQAQQLGALARARADQIAAARAATLARREADERRVRAAARVEKLERALGRAANTTARATQARATRLWLRVAGAKALMYTTALAVSVGVFASVNRTDRVPAVTIPSVREAATLPGIGDRPGETLRLKFAYRLAQRSAGTGTGTAGQR